jgi:hypothetical protein
MFVEVYLFKVNITTCSRRFHGEIREGKEREKITRIKKGDSNRE